MLEGCSNTGRSDKGLLVSCSKLLHLQIIAKPGYRHGHTERQDRQVACEWQAELTQYQSTLQCTGPLWLGMSTWRTLKGGWKAGVLSHSIPASGWKCVISSKLVMNGGLPGFHCPSTAAGTSRTL